jgi:hypothetical protein
LYARSRSVVSVFFLVLICFRASGTSADAVAAIITPLGNPATATALKNKASYRYPVTGWILTYPFDDEGNLRPDWRLDGVQP